MGRCAFKGFNCPPPPPQTAPCAKAEVRPHRWAAPYCRTGSTPLWEPPFFLLSPRDARSQSAPVGGISLLEGALQKHRGDRKCPRRWGGGYFRLAWAVPTTHSLTCGKAERGGPKFCPISPNLPPKRDPLLIPINSFPLSFIHNPPSHPTPTPQPQDHPPKPPPALHAAPQPCWRSAGS